MQQTPNCWTPYPQERLSGQIYPLHPFPQQTTPSWLPQREQEVLVGCSSAVLCVEPDQLPWYGCQVQHLGQKLFAALAPQQAGIQDSMLSC